MTLKNDRAPLLYYIKLCASFQSHRWIQTGVTVRKRSIRVKIGDFLFRVTLKFDEWPWKTIGHLFNATSSFVHHFIANGEFILELQSRNAQIGLIWRFFELCDLEIWWMTLKNYRAPLLCNIKLYTSFISSSFVNSNWSYSLETVKLGCDLCDLDLWPWPFAWTLPWALVITPQNFVMIWWWEHGEKGVTDGQMENTIH